MPNLPDWARGTRLTFGTTELVPLRSNDPHELDRNQIGRVVYDKLAEVVRPSSRPSLPLVIYNSLSIRPGLFGISLDLKALLEGLYPGLKDSLNGLRFTKREFKQLGFLVGTNGTRSYVPFDEAERILGNEVLNKMLDSGMLQRSDSAGLTCVVAHDLIAAVIAAYADVSRPPSQAPEAITILKEGVVPARPSVAASAPDEQVAVAKALVDEGIRLRTLSRGKEEIAVYDDVLARFSTARKPALREQVARALLNKGAALRYHFAHNEAAIAVFDDLLARFGTAREPALREMVAMALVHKGVTLGELRRGSEVAEIAIFDDLLARFGTASEPALREWVARALIGKGDRLEKLGRSEAAIAVYDELLTRFGTAIEPALRELVSMANTAKGYLRKS